MFPRRKDGGKDREKAPQTQPYSADATALPKDTRLKLPTDAARPMDPPRLSTSELLSLRDELLLQPFLYKYVSREYLQRLAYAEDIFKPLPPTTQARISQFILDHPGGEPAIVPHDSPSASPRAPMPVPADLRRTPSPPPQGSHADFCPEFRTVGSKKHSRLKDVERERDELRAEVARLDAEKQSFIGYARVLLTTSESDDWQPDRDPYDQLLELAHIMKASDEVTSEQMDTWIRKYNEKERQRITTLEETVQNLTTRLDEQTETSNQATENQARLEAENERLQQLLNARAKEYQERRQGQEERHSATLQRLINEHTAAMSEQMNVYEKELVNLRVAHKRELAENPEYEKELDKLVEGIKSLGRKHLRNSEATRPQDKEC